MIKLILGNASTYHYLAGISALLPLFLFMVILNDISDSFQ